MKKYEGFEAVKHEMRKVTEIIKKPLIIRRLIIIIEKNIKRLLSSKISAALILFGPLVLILMLGLAFQGSGFYGVKLGVYSTEYNDVSENVITAMEESDFTVIKEKTSEQCIENVKSAKTHLCIQFPVDFKAGKLAFFVDYSRLNLVYAIVSKINDEIDELSNQISLDVTQDLLDVISNSSDQLNSSSQLIQNLKSNSEELNTGLYTMGLNISSLEVGESQQLLDSLTDETSTINQNIQSARNDLNSLKITLQLVQSQSTQTIGDLKDQLVNIKSAQNAQGCAEISARDLTNYLNGDNFFNELQNEPNPTCSLLKTFETNLEVEIANLEEASVGVTEMISYVESMDTGITSMETQVKVEASSAKTKINELNSAKAELSRELFQLADATSNSTQIFDEMTQKLDYIVTEFDKIAMTDAKTVIKPIRTLIKPLNSKKINTLDIIFPAILVMIMMFVGILMGNILIMREKNTRAYFRNQIMPVSDYVFIIGTYLTTMLITFLQLGVIIIIGVIFFGTNLDFNLVRLFPILLSAIVIFTSIGVIIGNVAATEETSILAAIILSLIFLLFSNMIIPIETMSAAIGSLARLTPFNISEMLLRRTLVFGSNLSWGDVFMIGVFVLEFVGLVVGVWYSHRYSKKKNR